MKKLSHHKVGIAQGDTVLFSDFEDEGEMWSGEGPRQNRTFVPFDETFEDVPVVHVGLSMWDLSNDAYARVDVTTERVTTKGFDVIFRTWGDTKVARVRVRWMAIGSVTDEDAWDVK